MTKEQAINLMAENVRWWYKELDGRAPMAELVEMGIDRFADFYYEGAGLNDEDEAIITELFDMGDELNPLVLEAALAM